MEASKQTRFDALYIQHLRALMLQGKAAATVDRYARAVPRTVTLVQAKIEQAECSLIYFVSVYVHEIAPVDPNRNCKY
jgi:hypothetical protein